MRIITLLIAALAWLTPALSAFAQEVSIDRESIGQQVAQVQKQKDQAVTRVKAIVNQPVAPQPTSSWAMVKVLPGGWYDKGAKEPDYEKADIRATQQLPYASYSHVSTKFNPSEMFNGPELELNPATKFFYADEKMPKKRLAQAEMLEINGLYRVIAACNKRITELNNAPETMLRLKYFLNSTGGTVALLVIVSGLFLLVYRKMYPSAR